MPRCGLYLFCNSHPLMSFWRGNNLFSNSAISSKWTEFRLLVTLRSIFCRSEIQMIESIFCRNTSLDYKLLRIFQFSTNSVSRMANCSWLFKLILFLKQCSIFLLTNNYVHLRFQLNLILQARSRSWKMLSHVFETSSTCLAAHKFAKTWPLLIWGL